MEGKTLIYEIDQIIGLDNFVEDSFSLSITVCTQSKHGNSLSHCLKTPGLVRHLFKSTFDCLCIYFTRTAINFTAINKPVCQAAFDSAGKISCRGGAGNIINANALLVIFFPFRLPIQVSTAVFSVWVFFFAVVASFI